MISRIFQNGGGYSGVNFGHLKSEVFQNGGGGYSGVNFGHLKSELFRNGGVFRSKLWSSQIWTFPKWGGGGAFWSEIPERGFLENLDKNLLFSQKPACASQIVSHILRMWRLMSHNKYPDTCWGPSTVQSMCETCPCILCKSWHKVYKTEKQVMYYVGNLFKF